MFRRRSVSLSLVYGLGKTCSSFFRPFLGGYMFRRRSVSLSLVYGLCKTCSYFFRPVLGGFLFRRRSVSLSLVYGLSIIWSYFFRPVSGGLWPAGGGWGAGGGQQRPRLRQACRDRGLGQHDQGRPRYSRGPGGGRQDHPGQNHQVGTL